MRIENGQINLSSAHDLKTSSEVKNETRIHNKVETSEGDVYETEHTWQGVSVGLDLLSEREIDTDELSAMAQKAIRIRGQGISISTSESFRLAPSDTEADNSQLSAAIKKHYSRMEVDLTELSQVSMNRSTGAATIRDMQAEFLIRIMEMGLGRPLKEMSPEELGQMGLSEENIMSIRGYFNEQDAQRAQQQADINKLKGRNIESDALSNKTRTPPIEEPAINASQASPESPQITDPADTNTSAASVDPSQGAIDRLKRQAVESNSTSAVTSTNSTDQPENSENDEPIPPGMVRRTTTITQSRESIFREEEHTRFSAEGKVLTSDGREIDIELDIGMSRKFESTELAQSIKVLKDPLVVNFDGPAVALDDQRTFMFDIDMDGEEDQLSQLQTGSGFLALDKNGDGIINDGSELFGAQSGNGFADLAEYDEDGDGFIDEDDAVFSQLRIWVPGDEGESELFALLDKDVGAIHLNHVDTEFALNRMADNENMGYVRSSGVFLKESGGVGSVQQIDLAV